MTDTLNFDQFCEYLGRELGLEESIDLTKDTSLVDDLGFDSIRHLETIVAVEDLGVQLSDEDAGQMRTLGDLFDYYEREALGEAAS